MKETDSCPGRQAWANVSLLLSPLPPLGGGAELGTYINHSLPSKASPETCVPLGPQCPPSLS